MALERNEAWKLLSKVRGYLSAGEFAQLAIITLYQIMKERSLVERYLDSDDGYKELVDRFDKISSIRDKQLLNSFKKELDEYSDDQLKELAEYIFEFAIENGGKTMDSSNKQIGSLAIDLLKLEAGDMIFDLGSGYGNFLADVVRYSQCHGFELKDVIGYEINHTAASVSKLNLVVSGAKSFQINEGDFINGVPAVYNKGFAFPPLGMRFRENDKKIKSQLFKDYAFKPNRNSYEWVFVDRLLASLIGFKKRAVALLSPRCLFNEDDKEYRDLLLKSGWIESIIELPAGSLNFVGIKVCMIVFSQNNDRINILDASETIDRAKGKFASFKLPFEKVLGMLKTAPRKTTDELLESHSLAPSSLLAGQGIKFEGKPLSEMAEVFTGCQYTARNFEEMFSDEPTGYRILTSSDINDGFVEWGQLQAINYKETKFDKYAVKKDDVVVTAKSSKVKVVVVDIEPKEKILVTGGMLIVRPDVAKLNPTFLKIFLDSAKGQIALKMIQRGATIITINSKDLANVLIPEEAIEVQNSISKKYNSKLSSYLALKEEVKKLEEQLNNFDIEEMKEE